MARRGEDWKDEIGEPSMQEVGEELDAVQRYRREIYDIRMQLDEILDIYEGKVFPEDSPQPRSVEDWRNLFIYLKEDIKEQVKDPEEKEALLLEVALLEHAVWQQHLPYLASRVENYGAGRSLGRKSRDNLEDKVREIEELFEQGDAVLPEDLKGLELGRIFNERARELQERFSDYDKEPSTFFVRHNYKKLHRTANGILADLLHTYLYDYHPGQIESNDSLSRFQKKIGELSGSADEMNKQFERIRDLAIKKRYREMGEGVYEFVKSLEKTIEFLQKYIGVKNRLYVIAQRIEQADGIASETEQDKLRGIAEEIQELSAGLGEIRDYEMHLQLIYFYIRLNQELEDIWRIAGMVELGGRGEERHANPDIEKYYLTLGLSPGASEAEVKSAYRKLILRWHPDTKGGQDKEATARTQTLTEAYAMLKKAGLAK